MSKRTKKSRRSKTKQPITIDEFSHATLQQWRKRYRAAHDYHTLLYYDLAAQRAIHKQEIFDALSAGVGPISFDSWMRVVNFRFTLHPLSSVGSLKSIGGRFNYGEHIDQATFTAFPALYIAETDEVARAEYFQPPDPSIDLDPEDFLLMKPGSYSVVALRGHLTTVFDLRKKTNVRDFLKIINKFTISERVKKIGQIADESYGLLKTDKDLLDSLMEPSWRFLPMQYDVPSNSQIFGEIVRSAGFQGILYDSVRSRGSCLAVFPQNLDRHDVYVELVPPVPRELRLTRLDWTTWRELIAE